MTLTEAQVTEEDIVRLIDAAEHGLLNVYSDSAISVFRFALAQLRAQSKPSKVVCHAPGDRCHGCDHYRGKAAVCKYADEAQGQIRAREPVPIGHLLWPSLEFLFNGPVKRIGALSVNAQPIPVYAALKERTE